MNDFTVIEISREELSLLRTHGPASFASGPLAFDEETTEALYEYLLKDLTVIEMGNFLVSWTGSRVPRGAVVAGHTIGWTQHGLVRDENNDLVATYERLLDTPDRRLMLVMLQVKPLELQNSQPKPGLTLRHVSVPIFFVAMATLIFVSWLVS